MVSADDWADCAACLIEEILLCYQSLAEFSSLEPCSAVDTWFNKLVHLCRRTLDEAIVSMVRVIAQYETRRLISRKIAEQT